MVPPGAPSHLQGVGIFWCVYMVCMCSACTWGLKIGDSEEELMHRGTPLSTS